MQQSSHRWDNLPTQIDEEPSPKGWAKDTAKKRLRERPDF